MRKAAVWPLVVLLIALAFGVPTAHAASVTVTFAGPDKVKAGGTYTYTYEINVSSAAVAYISPVTASGAFERVSGGDGLMYDTIPENTSGKSVKGTIEVRVKANAKAGETATLSASGEYSVLDAQYNQTTAAFQGSFIASVVSGTATSATPTTTPSATPTAEPSTVPTATAAATPEVSQTAGGEPTPEATTAAAALTQAPTNTNGPKTITGQEQVLENGEAEPVLAANAGVGVAVWLIAGIVVIALAVGLVIVLYARRVGPFKAKEAAATGGTGYRYSSRSRGRYRYRR